MIGVNQQSTIQLEKSINQNKASPKSSQKKQINFLDKNQNISLTKQENTNNLLYEKSLNSPNSSIKKQKLQKLTKLYEASRLRLEQYRQKQRFFEEKKLEQLEIKRKIQKLNEKKDYFQNSYDQNLKMIKISNNTEFEKEKVLIMELQQELFQAEKNYIDKETKLKNLIPNHQEIQNQNKQNAQQKSIKKINEKLIFQLETLKQNLSYLQDKVWLEQQKAKQFYSEQMLNQQVCNIQYKIQVMKLTNQATQKYFLQIKTQIQNIEGTNYNQIEQQIKNIRVQCEQLMQKKNNILPQIKKFKDKRKVFKQSYLTQKQKITKSTANLRQTQQKLQFQNQKYQQTLKEAKQLEKKLEKQKGQPEQLQLLREKNNKILLQIKRIQLLYEKIKETMDNLAPKALAKQYEKKIKNLKQANQKMTELISQNELLKQENKQLLNEKDQIQWKNNPLQKQIESFIQKFESQNELLQKQTKALKKKINSLQSKLSILKQEQKLQKLKLQQEKQKQEKNQRENQNKQKEAEAALKRLIQRLDKRNDQQTAKSLLNQKNPIIIAFEPISAKKNSKSKKNTSLKQEKINQSKNYSKHSLKLEQISSSTQSSHKNCQQIEFGQSSQHNFHRQQEQQQLQPFIKTYPYCTYFIFLIMFFFIPGGWLMKFG